MKFSTCAKLVGVEPIDSETFIHTYEAPEIARAALPGHFLHIRVTHLSSPLLRRPISVLWADGELRVQVLFKVVKTGTALLAEKREGEMVDIVGPLGNPFSFDESRDSIMVAGGYGIAPVHFLAKANASCAKRKTLIYGARTARLLYLRGMLEESFDEVLYTTDDGSFGRKGVVTDIVRDLLSQGGQPAVYACGPNPMLAAVQARVVEAAGEPDIPFWVSMENQMGCGIGACLGCVIATREGFATTCKSGPVFNGYEVVFA